MQSSQQPSTPLLPPKLISYLNILRHLLNRLGFTLLDLALTTQAPQVPFPKAFHNFSISPEAKDLPYDGIPLSKTIGVFIDRVAGMGLNVVRIVVKLRETDEEEENWKFSLDIVKSVDELVKKDRERVGRASENGGQNGNSGENDARQGDDNNASNGGDAVQPGIQVL